MNRLRMIAVAMGGGAAKVIKPSDLPNLSLWVSSDYGLYTDTGLTTPVSSDGQTVKGWKDQSGQNNHLTQSTAGWQPLYKVNIKNGYPSVRFDGADDCISRASHTVSFLAPITVFVVLKSTSKTKGACWVGMTTGTSYGWTVGNVATFNNGGFAQRGIANRNGKINSVDLSNFYIVSNTFSSAFRWKYWTNGNLCGYMDTGVDNNTGASGINVGGVGSAGSATTGDFLEVIVYNRELTDKERRSIEQYLAGKYAITLRNDYYYNAPNYLTTPTYEASGQAIHPDVVYFSGGWNGKNYWMANTPFPNDDQTVENPSMLVSNDGNTWTVPVGLTNPIIPATGDANIWNNDASLCMSADGNTMWMFYVVTKSSATTYSRIYATSSTDGVTWSAPALLLDLAYQTIMSPSVIWDGAQYVMWSYNEIAYKVERRTCATPNGTWSVATNCTADSAQLSKHICVRLYNSVYYLTAMDTADTGFLGGYFASSSDGLAWNYDPKFKLNVGSGGWDDTQIYRSTFVPGATFDIWYSAYRTDAAVHTWHTGRTSYTP